MSEEQSIPPVDGFCCAEMRRQWTITLDSQDVAEFGWTHCPWCKAEIPEPWSIGGKFRSIGSIT